MVYTTADQDRYEAITGMPAYLATKGATVAFTRLVATDFALSDIRYNSDLPGYRHHVIEIAVISHPARLDPLSQSTRRCSRLMKRESGDESILSNVNCVLSKHPVYRICSILDMISISYPLRHVIRQSYHHLHVKIPAVPHNHAASSRPSSHLLIYGPSSQYPSFL